MSQYTRGDICAVACAEAFRGDGEIMASPMGPTPAIGARLAASTFEPDLVLTDGVSTILGNIPPYGVKDAEQVVEGWIPYRWVFDVVAAGTRHVMMGATQIDKFGNQNISCLGDFAQPKVQLLGARGAPGNTINHQTSYWVARHNAKVFVDAVDFVSGVGYDRAKELGELSARFHEIRVVVTNLGVFDFNEAGRMRIKSLHPGVELQEVIDNTGFELVIPDDIPTTREPTAEELRVLAVVDPNGIRNKEVPS